MDLDGFIAEQMRDPEFAREYRRASKRIDRRDRWVRRWHWLRRTLT